MRCLRRCCWLALLSHATAQELYARAKPTDVTSDASALLHACDVNGKLEDASGKVIETWASPETAKCETHVADYVKAWRTGS